MKTYLMYDYEQYKYIGEYSWALKTDCPRDKFEEFCSLSHDLYDKDEYEGIDLTDCTCDSEVLHKLLDVNGYEHEDVWLEVVNW